MSDRTFFYAAMLGIGFAFAIGFIGGASSSAAAAPVPELNVGPYLQMPGSDRIAVMWETTAPAIGTVRFGKPGNLDRTAKGRKPTKIHEVKLTGLEPATAYAYSIHWKEKKGSQEKKAGPFEFKTAPAIGTTKLRIAVYGDSRSNNEVHARCVKVMQKFNPVLVINTGDLVSKGTRYHEWKPQFFDPLAPLIRHVPIVAVLGNHEKNARYYYDFFSLPGNEYWWALDFGHIRFIALDTNKSCYKGSKQYVWLENELKNVPDDKWIVGLMHHPMFSAHPYRDVNRLRWALQPLFQEYGVDLVFVGHDHHYARCYPIGALSDRGGNTVQHITSGGGGAGLYPIGDRPWIEKAERIHNVTILDFDGDNLHVHAYSEFGKKIDDTTIVRNRKIQPDRFVAYDAVRWEHALNKQIAKIEPLTVTGSDIRTKVDWAFDSPFDEPMKVTARWVHGPQWKVETSKKEFLLEKGGQMRISAVLSATWPDCYPTPKLTLTLTDPQGGKLFRNDAREFHPVRVWARREIVAAKVPADIRIDGEPAEWAGILETSNFIATEGDRMATLKTRVRVTKDKDSLYVLALIDMADARLFGKGENQRDDADIFNEDESFALHLGNEYRTYTFCVNTRNTQFDAKGNSRSFNADWTSAVSKAAAQWYVEMHIPLKQLEEENLDRINFSHTDGKTETRSEWSTTFDRPTIADRYGYLR